MGKLIEAARKFKREEPEYPEYEDPFVRKETLESNWTPPPVPIGTGKTRSLAEIFKQYVEDKKLGKFDDSY